MGGYMLRNGRGDAGPVFVGRPFGNDSLFRCVWVDTEGKRHRENGPVEVRNDGEIHWAIRGEEKGLSRIENGKMVFYPTLEAQLFRNHLT